MPPSSSAARRRSCAGWTPCGARASAASSGCSSSSVHPAPASPRSCAPGCGPASLRDDTHFLPLPVIRPERAAISGATGLAASLETAFRERKAGRSRAVISQALQEPGGFDRLLVELQTLATFAHRARALHRRSWSSPSIRARNSSGQKGAPKPGISSTCSRKRCHPPRARARRRLPARQRALAIVGHPLRFLRTPADRAAARAGRAVSLQPAADRACGVQGRHRGSGARHTRGRSQADGRSGA